MSGVRSQKKEKNKNHRSEVRGQKKFEVISSKFEVKTAILWPGYSYLRFSDNHET